VVILIRLKNLPLDNIYITSNFGMRDLNNMWWHNGTDFRASTGTPVYSIDNGIVKVAKNNPTGYGLYVAIDHGEYGSLYAHLSKYVVTDGQSIKAGDLIGYSGNTGSSTAPHLHFEIRLGAYDTFWDRCKADSNVFMRCIDPVPFVKKLQFELSLTIEQAKKIVQENMGYDNNTMSFLSNFYKYSDSLLIKAARAVL